jgi:hypothetical protein
MPPTGPTVPSSSISPVAATFLPWSTSRPSFLHEAERHGQAGRRPADVAGVDLDRERQADVRRLLDEHAHHRALRVGRVGAEREVEAERLAAALNHDRDLVPGLLLGEDRPQLRERAHALPSSSTITSDGWRSRAAAVPGITWATNAPWSLTRTL